MKLISLNIFFNSVNNEALPNKNLFVFTFANAIQVAQTVSGHVKKLDLGFALFLVKHNLLFFEASLVVIMILHVDPPCLESLIVRSSFDGEP